MFLPLLLPVFARRIFARYVLSAKLHFPRQFNARNVQACAFAWPLNPDGDYMSDFARYIELLKYAALANYVGEPF